MTTSNPSTCPPERTLVLAINAELDEAEEKALAEHIETCEDGEKSCNLLPVRLFFRTKDRTNWLRQTPKTIPVSALNRVMEQMRDRVRRQRFSTAIDGDRCWNLASIRTLSVCPEAITCSNAWDKVAWGIVLKARDLSLDRIVAVKVLHPELAVSETARQRFIREAKAAAAVNHEHVVTIHAVDEHNGLPYLVMEFIQGTSLQDKIGEKRTTAADGNFTHLGTDRAWTRRRARARFDSS